MCLRCNTFWKILLQHQLYLQLQVSNAVPRYILGQNQRKRMKLFYEIVQQNRGRAQSLPAASHLPCLLDQLEDKLGDCRLAGVHLFALSCQEF